MEALEHIGTREAKNILENMSTGAAGAQLTQDAKAALQRLDRQTGP
jgi:hypothetical protein